MRKSAKTNVFYSIPPDSPTWGEFGGTFSLGALVHRDFKPENILLGHDGRPRVADFGIARVHKVDELADTPLPVEAVLATAERARGNGSAARTTESSTLAGRLTFPGMIAGTPGFMSPEQYRGEDVDARSDQFSFCSALFEALYGQPPFPGETLAELAENVHGPVRKPPSHSPIPIEIYHTLLIGLSVRPAQRFASMELLLSSLALEDSHHAGAGRFSLQQFAQVVVAITMIMALFVQFRASQRTLTYRQMISVSALSMAVALLGGLLKRRTLLENQFHRRNYILFTAFIVLNFGQRLLGRAFNTPMTQLVPFELLAMAANVAVAAATTLPALWWLPLFLIAAAAATVVAPDAMRPYLSAPYVLACFYSMLTWLRYSGKAKRGAVGSIQPITSEGSVRFSL